jgi:Tfp pilus assembly protein PilE
VMIPVAGQLGIGLLLTPLMLTYFYLMYEHLRELKGGAAAPEAKTEGKRWPWVIVAVVGLLAFLAVPAAAIILTAVNPVGQIAKARDASRLSDQQMIQGALERYFLVYGSYPQSLNTLVGAGELQEIPKDYQTQMPYDYQALNEGKNFRLCVKFESQDAKKLHDECVGSMGMPTATPGVGESGNYVTNLLDQQTARWDLARSAQMQSVKTPLELYYAENEVYPENLSDLVPKYFGQELKDPRTGEDYFYQQSEEGQNYLFCVSFESTEYENQLECVSKDGYSNKPNNSELNIDMENSQGM